MERRMAMSTFYRIGIFLLVAVLAGGCQAPENGRIYNKAIAAARASGNIPEAASLPSFDEAGVYIGKNAARVDLPYDVMSQDGAKTRKSYSVWFKRVARTWVVEDQRPTPQPASSGNPS